MVHKTIHLWFLNSCSCTLSTVIFFPMDNFSICYSVWYSISTSWILGIYELAHQLFELSVGYFKVNVYLLDCWLIGWWQMSTSDVYRMVLLLMMLALPVSSSSLWSAKCRLISITPSCCWCSCYFFLSGCAPATCSAYNKCKLCYYRGSCKPLSIIIGTAT